jgi:4-hydroxybenzoate polyprenyltransferase
MDDNRPLVLDVDGTFLRTDLVHESFWAGLGRAPRETLRAVAGGLSNPAGMKAELAQLAQMRIDLMPVNADVADTAMEALREGREVVLASPSYEGAVEEVAQTYGLSAQVYASSPSKNMRAEARARALVSAYGEGGFDYAGNSSADRAIWDKAQTALVVGDVSAMRGLIRKGKLVRSFPGGWKITDLLRALRPHQWVKNVLLMVPMLAAHDFTLASLIMVLIGMVSLSAGASSIYIVNDLLDLEADRLHPTKRNRPFAAGKVPIRVGMVASVFLALFALGAGLWLNLAFFGVVLLYMLLSLTYSLKLKRLRWVDLFTLAGLYTMRVVAGGAAIGAFATGNLIVFILPVFLTLASVKRLTELGKAQGDARLPGRGYARSDREDLRNMAWMGMFFALLSFLLYSFSEQAQTLYASRWLLWVSLVPIFLWLRRMVRLGDQGQMDYDPVVFALRDKRGIGLLFITLSIMFYSAGLWQRWFGF